MGIIANQLSARLQSHIKEIDELGYMIGKAIDQVEKMNSEHCSEFLSPNEMSNMKNNHRKVMKLSQRLSTRVEEFKSRHPITR